MVWTIAAALVLTPLGIAAGGTNVDSVVVMPDRVELHGPFDRVQLLVLGRLHDGTSVDLTRHARLSVSDESVARVTPTGRVVPTGAGECVLSVRVADHEYAVPVIVDRARQEPDFISDVVPAISRGGCNSGACHGAPSGKRGFRLSLRGHDPSLDYVSLTRDVLGRRVITFNAEESLILKKASGRVPHEGGVRLRPGDLEYTILRDWIAAGANLSAEQNRSVQSIAVTPEVVRLADDRNEHQLRVVARYSDGTVRDVTHLSVFSSSNEEVAGVGADGLVRARSKGEAAILVRYLDQIVSSRVSYVVHSPDFVWEQPEEFNFIDRCINEHLRELEIAPAALCEDHEFLRRAYLDLLGVLPTAEEARAFLTDSSPDKRARLVDELLRRPEFSDFWAMKWLDVLGVNERKVGKAGAARFHAWLRLQIARNRPLDQLVRELLSASGNPVQNPATYFAVAWKQPPDAAETVAQVFLGVRMQCARCHNHPFERWTQDDYYGLAAFFSRVRFKKTRTGTDFVYEDDAGELKHPRTGATVLPRPLLSEPVSYGPGLRDKLADWLVSPDNELFAQAAVNRVWYHLFGRGIVDPPDDIRDSNPPAHERLLIELGRYFAEHGYDLRDLIRTIMTSATYQRSSRPNRWNRSDDRYFSRAIPRLLSAEQLLNAICAATGVPERFAGMPPGVLATQLPDPGVNHPFLKAFGQPNRDLPCECERSTEPSLTQVLELINGPLVAEKLSASENCLTDLLRDSDDRAVITELYLRTLNRLPSEQEIKELSEYVAGQPDRRRAYEDILWSLLNSRQFLYRL